MERRIGQLLLAGVLTAAVCLLAGLMLWLAGAGGAAMLMNAGILVLMATPVVRVAVAVLEYVRVRDWWFAAAALTVLVIVVLTVVYSVAGR